MTLVLAALTLALSSPLCEPPEERWTALRAARTRTMGLLVAAATRTGIDPRFVLAIGERESHFRPFVRHPRDSRYSRSAYVRSDHRYGWTIEWPRKARREVDLEAMIMTPGPNASSSYGDPVPWISGGLGVLGMVPANHVWRWDPTANPEVLCDPVIAVIVFARLTTWAIREYQAATWLDVHSVYAGRVKGGRTYASETRDEQFCARTRRWGLACRDEASSRTGWGPTRGQEEIADQIRGETIEAYAARLREERAA